MSLMDRWSKESLDRATKTVAFSSSTANTTTPIAAAPGKTQILRKVFLVSAGVDSVQFKSAGGGEGTVNKSGAIPLAANGIIDLPDADIKSESGGAITITKAQAVAVVGYVNIAVIDE